MCRRAFVRVYVVFCIRVDLRVGVGGCAYVLERAHICVCVHVCVRERQRVKDRVCSALRFLTRTGIFLLDVSLLQKRPEMNAHISLMWKSQCSATKKYGDYWSKISKRIPIP